MAMMQDLTTFAGAQASASLATALADVDVSEYAGEGVESVNVYTDHVHDKLVLSVRHVLATRRELDNGDFRRLAWPRIRRAILGDETQSAKYERVERRRLIARGAEARAAKPRKRVA
jgi:hypothetical protein